MTVKARQALLLQARLQLLRNQSRDHPDLRDHQVRTGRMVRMEVEVPLAHVEPLEQLVDAVLRGYQAALDLQVLEAYVALEDSGVLMVSVEYVDREALGAYLAHKVQWAQQARSAQRATSLRWSAFTRGNRSTGIWRSQSA
jgi:hypothetical protein